MGFFKKLFSRKPYRFELEMKVDNYTVILPIEIKIDLERIREQLEDGFKKKEAEIKETLKHSYKPPELISQDVENLINPYGFGSGVRINAGRMRTRVENMVF